MGLQICIQKELNIILLAQMALSTDSTQQLDQILELSWGVPLSQFQPGNVGDLSPHCIEASRSITEVENMQLMV